MKRFVFLLMFTIGFSDLPSFAQSQHTVDSLRHSADSLQKVLNDSTKLTVKTVYEDAKAGIQGLAKALKAPAEHVYFILVRQQVVKSITLLLVTALFFTLALVLFRWHRRKAREYITKNGDWESDDAEVVIPLTISIIAALVFVGMVIGCSHTIVTGLFNPEYGAIKDIFEFIKH